MSVFAVLGFRPHTYWTAVVAVTGEAGAPQILARRRIEFAAGKERFVYHQAAEGPPGAAAALIAEVGAAVEANAGRMIGDLVSDLRSEGVSVHTAVVPAGGGKARARLEEILGSHARIHAAEGEFYRDAVAAACAALGLEVRRVIERELPALAADLAGIGESALEARLKAMGAALGPPWSEDQKLAMLAAWLHLEGGGPP